MCFRCQVRGDAIAFVQQIEQLSFRDAALRLDECAVTPVPHIVRRRGPFCHGSPVRGDDEVRALAAAVELYANRLLGDERALGYLAERGFTRGLLVRQSVGFAAGDELVPYLAWRDVPVSAARRVGLLRSDGRERLAGRVVLPEIRQRQPVWLIGRLLAPADDLPRYLGLPGPKPLMGWIRQVAIDAVSASSRVRSICSRCSSGACLVWLCAGPVSARRPCNCSASGSACTRCWTPTRQARRQPCDLPKRSGPAWSQCSSRQA